MPDKTHLFLICSPDLGLTAQGELWRTCDRVMVEKEGGKVMFLITLLLGMLVVSLCPSITCILLADNTFALGQVLSEKHRFLHQSAALHRVTCGATVTEAAVAKKAGRYCNDLQRRLPRQEGLTGRKEKKCVVPHSSTGRAWRRLRQGGGGKRGLALPSQWSHQC